MCPHAPTWTHMGNTNEYKFNRIECKSVWHSVTRQHNLILFKFSNVHTNTLRASNPAALPYNEQIDRFTKFGAVRDFPIFIPYIYIRVRGCPLNGLFGPCACLLAGGVGCGVFWLIRETKTCGVIQHIFLHRIAMRVLLA